MQKNRKNKKAQMYALIREYEQSGLTQDKFFDQYEIPKSTFCYWRKKYLKETGRSKTKSSFIPVEVDPVREKQCDVLELVYPNGVRLVFSSEMDLSRLKPLIVL